MNFFRRKPMDGITTPHQESAVGGIHSGGWEGGDDFPAESLPDDPYSELGLRREEVAPTPGAAEQDTEDSFGQVGALGAETDAFLYIRTASDRRRSAAAETESRPETGQGLPPGPALSPPAGRRIWDLDPGDPEANPPEATVRAFPGPAGGHSGSREPDAAFEQAQSEPLDDVALARAQIAQFSEAGLHPSGPSSGGGRAKTRLLGFQSAELAQRDPFGRESVRGGRVEPVFPVGWVIVLDGPGRGACFILTAGVSSIGRGEDQTVCLDFGDTSISRQNHASIAYDDEANRFFLGHGGKSNIVRLNDRPVLSTEDLAGGDTIRIGETVLRFVAFCGEDFVWSVGDSDGEVADVAAV